jgi:nucleoside-diphosphate-sugar epimerase
MREHVLVTGGAGYLGSTLVPALLDAGYRVTVLDSFLYRQASLNHVCHHPAFEVVRGDIRDERVIAPLLARADVVIPLAALVGAPLCDADPVGARTVNHDAILSMLALMSPSQRVLMPTTNSAYGTGDEHHHCTETSPLRPISRYARDKVEVESKLMQRENAVSFRLATVFGMSPRMRIDLLVNDFTYRAVHDRFVVLFEGDFKRNYVHGRDVARVFLHGLERFDAMRGQVFNVGLSDANVSKRELCDRIRRHLPDFVALDAPVGKDPDQRNYVVSNAKIEAAGFRTGTSLDAGIVELVKGFAMLRNTVHGNV